jgi:uncharacterized protein (TIGR00730 family)
MDDKAEHRALTSALEDARTAKAAASTPQTRSPAYRLAYCDDDFLMRDELRPARLELEMLKTELLLRERGIGNTVVIFGGARIREPSVARERADRAAQAARDHPADAALAHAAAVAQRLAASSRFYDEARELASLVARNGGKGTRFDLTVVTGGGPGIMEAGNRGAHEAGAESVGLNIVLPMEQAPNEYITPELCFQFHYFAIRKMHFLMRARALAAFPGGFGTLDELFETLTLIQTGKVRPMPVLLFGKEYWRRIIDFGALVEEGTVGSKDLDIFRYVETAREAWEIIAESLSFAE